MYWGIIMQRGTFQLMKSVNKSLILNKIRTSEPISRAQIAKEVKLTPPTVSSIVRELIEQDLVMESELGESQGGRKPTMLQVNRNGFYVIGVDAGPRTIRCIVSNLSGQIKHNIVVPIEGQLTNDTFLTLLKDSIRMMVEKVANHEKILGIGIAMHGVVDVEAGISLFAPILKLSNISIKEELEREFDLVVQVENDARAMALGESWFGTHEKVSSMVAVNLGIGVGAGIIIDGKLHHGALDLAGEVGHMTIDINGERCTCGNRGCLETYVSAPAITRRAAEVMPPSNISSSKQVFELARQGNEECIQVLQQTGEFIGIGLTNLIHIFNPALIVLGGGVSKAEQFILPPIQQEIEKRSLTNAAKETEVFISDLEDNATILGTVALLLVELFDPR